MRVSDEALDQVRTREYTIVPGFLGEEELAAARACLWQNVPPPDAYFADPSAHPRLARSQFAGLRLFAFHGWELNRLACHPDLVEAVGRYLGATDLQLYKVELWAKYAGAVDYDQPLHRDFGNHSLVVPRADGRGAQLTTFLLLSDVTEQDGPTIVVPLDGPAGTLFGFPAVGDDYWNDQTRRDVQRRYPGMDLQPYRASGPVTA